MASNASLGLPITSRSPRVHPTRHGKSPPFAACAHANCTRQVGVCMATSGPGAYHPAEMCGLYYASSTTLLWSRSSAPEPHLARGHHRRGRSPELFKDVASEFVSSTAWRVPARHLIDRAMRVASVANVTSIIPPDVLGVGIGKSRPPHGLWFSSWAQRAAGLPHYDDLHAAAEILNKRPRSWRC